MRTTWLIPALLSTATVGAQSPEDPAREAWALLRPLVGHWEGAIDGRLGTGRGVRDYELILDDRFLLFRHASVRAPQEKSPKGDHHRELCVFSFDTERNRLVLREFFVEGVVNRYTCDVSGRRIVCLTEHVENGGGLRARLTLDIQDGYGFDETFELAPAGEDFAVYFTNRWTRAPLLE